MNQTSNKILIVGPSWVGDMIMTQSLFMTLKQQDPDCSIDVLAPEWTRPLLERMPEVNDALSMDLKHGELGWGKRKAIGRSLRAQGYDQCIVIPNSLKSALIPYFSQIPKRTGWLKEPRYVLLNDLRKLDKTRYPLMVQRLCALAFEANAELPESLPNPKLVIDNAQIDAALTKHDLSNDKNILVLCPGAEFGSSKRWPECHYADVAQYFIKHGWQIWLFGSANDFDVCDQIDQLTAQQCINLAGKTSLAEAMDLMSLASLVISNDSGLMHMAAALGRPQVAVYGSTSTEFTPPLSEQCEVAQEPIECSPCFKRECPLGHHRCMQDLQPARVLDLITTSDKLTIQLTQE